MTVTDCIKNVSIPCTVSNINAKDIKELSLKWIFGKTLILTFEGHSNTYSKIPTFKSAQISTSAFLKGDASLTLDTNEAKAGNYTCEVKELSREGRHTVELKYHCGKWHTLNMVCLFAYTSGIWIELMTMLGGSLQETPWRYFEEWANP